MREDWKQKRKQAPEPDGGGACVWILNLSLWYSVNALYQNLCAGTRKNPERRRENQESGKELAPLRSARNPPNLQANSKNIPSPHQAKSTHYLMFSRMGQNERGLETKKKAGPGAGWRRGLRVDS